MSKISKADVTALFTDLVNATKNTDKEAGKKEFIAIISDNQKKLNQPMDIPFANGNTINHSIARAVKECKTEGCGLCISQHAASFGTNYGEAPYIVFKYINDNDDLKTEYKKLFSESYKNIHNNHAKKYTPIDFAEECNPAFAEYMNNKPKQNSVSNSIRTSVKSAKKMALDVISGSKKSLSRLAEQATSSKQTASAKENKSVSVNDEDLTAEQLEAKIAGLESNRKIRHYQFNSSIDEKTYKNSEEFKRDKKEDDDLDAEIKRLQKMLIKKTPFLNRALGKLGRKGGKTRKHKKSNKRRSYRRN